MPESLPPLSPLDWALLGGLGLSMLMGLWRGLVFEVMALLGWVAAWWAAQAFGPAVGEAVPWKTSSAWFRAGSGYAIVFLAVWLTCAVAARLSRRLLSLSGLGGLDRLAGALFGAARGLVMLLALTALLMWTPLVRSEDWRGSVVAQQLEAWVATLRPYLPSWPGLRSWTPPAMPSLN